MNFITTDIDKYLYYPDGSPRVRMGCKNTLYRLEVNRFISQTVYLYRKYHPKLPGYHPKDFRLGPKHLN